VVRSLIVLALTTAVIVSFIPVYAQEQAATEQEMVVTEKISGTVVSINEEEATVLVRQLTDKVNAVYEETSVRVLPFTKISKGEIILNLSDLMVEDKVTVEYSKDTEGNLEAVTISVE